MEIARKYALHFVLYFDAMAKHLGLTSNDVKCLVILHSSDPMTPGALAKRAGLSPGGVTRVLNHLESRSFIKREPIQADRRTQLIVPLPPTTPHRHGQKSADLHTAMAAMAQHYTPAEMAIVLDFMKHGAKVLEKATQALRSNGKAQRGTEQANTYDNAATKRTKK
jgi:predicted ArsR family transcriptional regulator